MYYKIVTDENIFLEIDEKKIFPNFISKIYLEKDLYFKSNEFLEFYEYIHYYFSNLKSKDKKQKILKNKFQYLFQRKN